MFETILVCRARPCLKTIEPRKRRIFTHGLLISPGVCLCLQPWCLLASTQRQRFIRRCWDETTCHGRRREACDGESKGTAVIWKTFVSSEDMTSRRWEAILCKIQGGALSTYRLRGMGLLGTQIWAPNLRVLFLLGSLELLGLWIQFSMQFNYVYNQILIPNFF